MRTLRLLHKWFGLIVGVQLLLWTVSGLVFAWLDHGAVTAEHSVREPEHRGLPPTTRLLEPATLLAGLDDARLPVVELYAIGDTWVYRLQFADRVELRSAADGAPVAIDELQVRQLAGDRYAGAGALRAVARHTGPTLDMREAEPSWEASFDDPQGTSLYFSGTDGRFLAARNDTWRLYDFFWMLHTMDYRGRDDFNNPLVILVTTGALWLGISGVLLLLQSFGLTKILDSGPGSRPHARRR